VEEHEQHDEGGRARCTGGRVAQPAAQEVQQHGWRDKGQGASPPVSNCQWDLTASESKGR
jgi:hypothetical protein